MVPTFPKMGKKIPLKWSSIARLFRVYNHENFFIVIKLQITMASLRTPTKIDTILSTFTDGNKEKIDFVPSFTHL
jgi:hypothetical protein